MTVVLLATCSAFAASKGKQYGKTVIAVVDWEYLAMNCNKAKTFDGLLNTLRTQEEKKVDDLAQKLQPRLDKEEQALYQLSTEYGELLEKEKAGDKTLLVKKKQKEKEYSIIAEGRDKYFSEATKQMQDAKDAQDKAMNAAQLKYTQEVVSDIIAAIKTISKRESIDIILSKTPAGVIWTSDGIDVTEDVLKELNK